MEPDEKTERGVRALTYEEFIESKKPKVIKSGFEVDRSSLNPLLFDWQKDIVYWALRKGRAALFEDCGLGKTPQQLEWSQKVVEHTARPVLIVAPLAVAEQTRREGDKFGYGVTVCRTQADVKDGINICNYEMLEHFDPAAFSGVVLDESSILKAFMGKIRNQIIHMFRDTEYKLSCTATPAPNDYMELGNQAEFLGIMSRPEMLSTYFVHDGGRTSQWRLKGHAQDHFWTWMASWAVVLTNPIDLGYPQDDFILPELYTKEWLVKTQEEKLHPEQEIVIGKTLTERRDARRNSLKERCAKAAELVASAPEEQWLIWCDLNAESEELARIIPRAVEVRGSDKPELKTARLNGFSDGSVHHMVSKPSIAGLGLNWQHCHNMIFVGLSDSYEMMYQAIRRCWRFGQEHPVNVHIVTSAAEGAVKENIERKEKQFADMISEMVKHTKEILESEIRGTERITLPYDPQVSMRVPDWIRSAA